MVVMFYKTLISLFTKYHLDLNNNGSVALLLQNTKCNVNPGLSQFQCNGHFERCALACARLLANLHLRFAFRQSKATLPNPIYILPVPNIKITYFALISCILINFFSNCQRAH